MIGTPFCKKFLLAVSRSRIWLTSSSFRFQISNLIAFWIWVYFNCPCKYLCIEAAFSLLILTRSRIVVTAHYHTQLAYFMSHLYYFIVILTITILSVLVRSLRITSDTILTRGSRRSLKLKLFQKMSSFESNNEKMQVKKLSEFATIPVRGSKFAAGRTLFFYKS